MNFFFLGGGGLLTTILHSPTYKLLICNLYLQSVIMTDYMVTSILQT